MQKTVNELADICQASRDTDVPTPLEYGFGLISDAAFEDQQTNLLNVVNEDDVNQYEAGWEAGLAGDLDISTMPANHKLVDESRAWLAGFAAGQYALANGYSKPFCVDPGHDHDGDSEF
jgi:hypothetical protein